MLMRRLGFLMIAVLISTGTVIGARSWLQSQLAAREPPPVQPTVAAIENRMVLVTKGEPISDGRVVRPGDRGFMAAVLTPGNRAVTVPVTPSSGLAGFVFPGDRVDVILTMTIQPDKEGEKVEKERRASETVLTGIRVLATDQRADDQKREVTVAKTATLEVTPKQAEVIAVVSEMGKISLSLRSLAQDGEQVTVANTHTWDNDAARLLRALHGTGHKVSVVRGSERKDVDFA